MKKITTTLLILFSLLSCNKEVEILPIDPLWGKDVCAHCRMEISEKEHAVQKITKDGERLYFDDFICAHKNKINGELFVLVENKWIKAKDAHYKKGLKTPMGGGISAQKDGNLNYDEAILELDR